MSDLDPEVFATYTGPDGGLTSISKLEDKLNVSMQAGVYRMAKYFGVVHNLRRQRIGREGFAKCLHK